MTTIASLEGRLNRYIELSKQGIKGYKKLIIKLIFKISKIMAKSISKENAKIDQESPIMPFGKYKGMPIDKMGDKGYLQWAINNLDDLKLVSLLKKQFRKLQLMEEIKSYWFSHKSIWDKEVGTEITKKAADILMSWDLSKYVGWEADEVIEKAFELAGAKIGGFGQILPPSENIKISGTKSQVEWALEEATEYLKKWESSSDKRFLKLAEFVRKTETPAEFWIMISKTFRSKFHQDILITAENLDCFEDVDFEQI